MARSLAEVISRKSALASGWLNVSMSGVLAAPVFVFVTVFNISTNVGYCDTIGSILRINRYVVAI